MKFSLVILVLIATGISMSAHTKKTRPVPAWDFDKLESLSTHVIIAIPVENRMSTEDEETPDWIGDADDVDSVFTKFKISATLKGSINEDFFSIHHFKLSKNHKYIGNGPCFVDFESFVVSTDRIKRLPRSKRPQFLLFLRKSENGGYSFVTGIMDSEYSVKKIQWY